MGSRVFSALSADSVNCPCMTTALTRKTESQQANFLNHKHTFSILNLYILDKWKRASIDGCYSSLQLTRQVPFKCNVRGSIDFMHEIISELVGPLFHSLLAKVTAHVTFWTSSNFRTRHSLSSSFSLSLSLGFYPNADYIYASKRINFFIPNIRLCLSNPNKGIFSPSCFPRSMLFDPPPPPPSIHTG